VVKSRRLWAVGLVAVVVGIAGLRAAQAPESASFDVASVKVTHTTEGPGIVQVRPGRLWIPNNSVRMTKSRLLTTAGFAVLVSAGTLIAQAPAPPTFEVASVKPNAAGSNAPQRGSPFVGDRVTIGNMTLQTIIQMAYQINPTEIMGAPSWIANERFDITAKAAAPSPSDQLRSMLQSLLAERFKLATHMEARSTPVYALMIARSDGRLGPLLHPEARDCESLRVVARAKPGTPDPCAGPSGGSGSGPGHIVQKSRPIDLLTTILRPYVDRPILNRTGLTGSYDWDLTFALQRLQAQGADSDGTTIFTALQEQLGLKLQPTTASQDMLVVDHVEHPTED
jgi:uncharacterized protein (TIGR03435 family)